MAFLSYKSKAIDDLCADMLAALYPDPDDPATMSVEYLQRFVYESLLQCMSPRSTGTSKEKYLALKIFSQVLHWLETDSFDLPFSKHIFVNAWSSVLNTLFTQSGLRTLWSSRTQPSPCNAHSTSPSNQTPRSRSHAV